ncbi:MAG: hypothetical protein FWD22_01250 [Treponema sp.]|nr:hypothetical protein [Treponema sp.]
MKNFKFLVTLIGVLVLTGCPIEIPETHIEEKTNWNVQGTGNFAYDITLPEGLIKADLILRSVTKGIYSGRADLLGDENNKGALSSIPSGYYRVTFDLSQEDYTNASKTETVYINKDQTTTLTVDFSYIDFTPAPDPVRLYAITNSGTFNLDNLSGNDIYAVAVNKGARFVPYTEAGSVISYILNGTKYQVASTGRSADPGIYNNSDRGDSYAEKGDKVPLQFDNPRASELNANPLPIPAEDRQAARSAAFVQPAVGDKRMFWLDDAGRGYVWQQKQATLAAVSNHANIWILDEYFDNNSVSSTDNKLNTAQAIAMAEKFDAIYQYTTPIFGYEYGGGPNSSAPGGVDGDTRVQILLYDIGAAGASGGTIGYYWNKDFYTNEYLQSLGYSIKSNRAEIFYINSYWADSRPDVVYSALIHEYIHMINFNEKFVKYGLNYSTWYTEMLAMLGEDIIGPMIGIDPSNSGHPVSMRIPYTLGLYTCDPFFWTGSRSYGVTFGYGAYLARNFGGAALVREIAQNNRVNFESVNSAISMFNPGINFVNTVERYYEAFVNNDTHDRGAASFNRTVTSAIAGHQYTLYGFDIFTMNRVNVALSLGYISYWSTTEKGPFVYGLTQNFFMDYYSFILMSCADWKNASGNMTVDMRIPASATVNLHLAVR